MLHEQRSPGYQQRLFIPACPPAPEAVVHLDVLGRLRGTGRFDLRQHCRRLSLHVVQAGRGEVILDGRSFRVVAGDAFLFRPGMEAHYREERVDPWRYTWVGFLGPAAADLLARSGFPPGQEVRSAVGSTALWRCFDRIEEAFASGGHGEHRSPAAAWELLDLIAPRTQAAERRDPAAMLARIIEAGYGAGLRVAGLAADLGVDRSTLFRRFRDAYGCSPQEFLLRSRLERAQDLLRRGDLPVAVVAARCGFADLRGFTRAFIARFAVTPGRFRRGLSSG